MNSSYQILGLGHELSDMRVEVTDAYDLLITTHGKQFRVSSALTSEGGLMVRAVKSDVKLVAENLTNGILEIKEG